MRAIRPGHASQLAFAAALLLGVPLAGAARAQDDRAIDACHNKESTTDIVGCLDQLTAQWDKRLNGAYQAAIRKADPAAVAPLRAAERAWLDYRKQRCAYLSTGEGTIMQILGADCILRMTKARAEELTGDAMGLAGPGG